MSPASSRDLEPHNQHIAEEQAYACFQTMTVQTWHGENCAMEEKVVKCSTPVQTNGCPLAGAEGLVLNKVESLWSPAPPRGHSHGTSTALIVVVIAIVLLAVLAVGLLGWDYSKRRKRARWGGGARNDRMEYQRETTTDMTRAQPNMQHQLPRDASVANLPGGLQMPRRPEAAARAPEYQVRDRLSEGTGRTLIASDGQVRSVTSDTTLRDASNVDDDEGRMSNLEGMLTSEGASSSVGSLVFVSNRAAPLDDIAEYRSWITVARG